MQVTLNDILVVVVPLVSAATYAAYNHPKGWRENISKNLRWAASNVIIFLASLRIVTWGLEMLTAAISSEAVSKPTIAIMEQWAPPVWFLIPLALIQWLLLFLDRLPNILGDKRE